MWQNPADLGVPPFTTFIVLLRSLTPSSQDVRLSQNSVNNIDSLFINTLTVTGLDPNTNYNTSVRAVSIHPAVGGGQLMSDTISKVITTTTSGMLITTAGYVNLIMLSLL